MSKRTTYTLGDDTIIVEIFDYEESFHWRMCVSGDWSHKSGHYAGLLLHCGYGLASAYWSPEIREFVPFRLQYAEEKK